MAAVSQDDVQLQFRGAQEANAEIRNEDAPAGAHRSVSTDRDQRTPSHDE